DYVFKNSDFDFNDVDDGDTLAAIIIESLPTNGSLMLNGTAVTAGQRITVDQIGNLVFRPAADQNGANYASFTFRVEDSNGGRSDSASTFTIFVDAIPRNPTSSHFPSTMLVGSDYVFKNSDFEFNDVDDGDT